MSCHSGYQQLSAAALGDFVVARNALDEFSDAGIARVLLAGGNTAVLGNGYRGQAPLAVLFDTSLLLWLARRNFVKLD